MAWFADRLKRKVRLLCAVLAGAALCTILLGLNHDNPRYLVACVFAAGVLSQWTGRLLPGVGNELSLVARWLMAWGEAFSTGMLVAIFVAFRPEWLATYADRIYLPPR